MMIVFGLLWVSTKCHNIFCIFIGSVLAPWFKNRWEKRSCLLEWSNFDLFIFRRKEDFVFQYFYLRLNETYTYIHIYNILIYNIDLMKQKLQSLAFSYHNFKPTCVEHKTVLCRGLCNIFTYQLKKKMQLENIIFNPISVESFSSVKTALPLFVSRHRGSGLVDKC